MACVLWATVLERTEHAFEIQDVGRDLIERFSQRRVQVQQLTEELRADSTRLTLLYVKYKLKSRFDSSVGGGKIGRQTGREQPHGR